MELPLETQIKSREPAASVQQNGEPCPVRHLAALNRYFLACGLVHAEQRYRLAVMAAEKLAGTDFENRKSDWEHLIAAAGQIRTEEFGSVANDDPRATGRKGPDLRNLQLIGVAATVGTRPRGTGTIGTPAKSPCPMPRQDLSISRPSLSAFLRSRFGEAFGSAAPARRMPKGLVPGVFCLALMLVP